MKKYFLVIILLFSLVFFIGSSYSTNLIGKWILEDDRYASLYMVQSIEFFEDGTGIVKDYDDIYDFTWTLVGNRLRIIYYEGTTWTYNIEIIGTKLTEYYDDRSFSIYRKQKK